LEELPPRCPVCQGIVKMDTVMFGEPIPPDVLQSSRAEALRCDCMLLIGTSGVVYPAAGLALIAKRRSAALIEVNPNKTELSDIVDIALRGTAGEILPQIVNRVKRLQGGRQS
jgi:NAD-dependent deacetylase